MSATSWRVGGLLVRAASSSCTAGVLRAASPSTSIPGRGRRGCLWDVLGCGRRGLGLWWRGFERGLLKALGYLVRGEGLFDGHDLVVEEVVIAARLGKFVHGGGWLWLNWSYREQFRDRERWQCQCWGYV